MTPQELKNSILQLAIQGKLVEQRPEEGSARMPAASTTEKKKAQRHGDLSSDAQFEAPFDIPESWRWAYLETVVNSVPSKQYQILESEVHQSGLFPVISQSKEYSIGFTDDSDKLYRHESPVVVFGDHTAEVKYVDFDFVVGADGIKIFYPLDTVVTAKYLFHVLQLYSNDICKLGGYSRHYKFLKTKPIPLPPLPEQHRIVSKIEELQPLIDRYAEAWTKLETFNKRFPEDMQKSLLQLAIQGKLVEQRPEEGSAETLYRQIQSEKHRLVQSGKIKKEKPLPEITEDEIPFEIPATWKWVRFGELGNYKKGPFGSAITKSMFVPKGNGAIKVYEQKNAIQKDATLGEYYIRREYFESKLKGFELSPGDIIVSCAGTIGETYVMPDEFEKGIINQALMRMKIFKPLYIPYFLLFFDFMLKRNAIRSSKGSAIKNIPPFEILKNYLVPIPPLTEQKRIVAKLEEILPLCERLK